MIASQGYKAAGKITIWGRKSSVNVQSVLWCLEELELAYSRIDAGFTYGVVTSPAFLKMNPNGKVPVLIDGNGIAIFEAGAIYATWHRNMQLGHSGQKTLQHVPLWINGPNGQKSILPVVLFLTYFGLLFAPHPRNVITQQ